MRRLLLVSTLGLLLSTASAFAHHPFAAEYDENKTLTLNGTVTKLEWVMPHPMVHVDVTDTRGTRTAWAVELGDVDALIGIGWTPNSLKPGDQITIDGWQAKNGTNRANAKSITMPNGAPLSALVWRSTAGTTRLGASEFDRRHVWRGASPHRKPAGAIGADWRAVAGWRRDASLLQALTWQPPRRHSR